MNRSKDSSSRTRTLRPKRAVLSNKHKEILQRLERVRSKTENQYCADCDKRGPAWVSILQPPHTITGSNYGYNYIRMGIFCCHQCINYHMMLGKDICEIKNIRKPQDWTDEEIRILEAAGNDIVSVIYEGKLFEAKPSPLQHRAYLNFLRAKYQQLDFFCLQTYEAHHGASWTRIIQQLQLDVFSKTSKRHSTGGGFSSPTKMIKAARELASRSLYGGKIGRRGGSTIGTDRTIHGPSLLDDCSQSSISSASSRGSIRKTSLLTGSIHGTGGRSSRHQLGTMLYGAGETNEASFDDLTSDDDETDYISKLGRKGGNNRKRHGPSPLELEDCSQSSQSSISSTSSRGGWKAKPRGSIFDGGRSNHHHLGTMLYRAGETNKAGLDDLTLDDDTVYTSELGREEGRSVVGNTTPQRRRRGSSLMGDSSHSCSSSSTRGSQIRKPRQRGSTHEGRSSILLDSLYGSGQAKESGRTLTDSSRAIEEEESRKRGDRVIPPSNLKRRRRRTSAAGRTTRGARRVTFSSDVM